MTVFVEHGEAHREVILKNGNLHVFANENIFKDIENNVYGMMDNNLAIPRNVYMSLTPDAHYGVGTCIGTTAVWREHNGFISPSIVGSDIGCGMRVHLTDLHRDDVKDKDIRRKIIEGIENYVSTQEKATGYFANFLDLEEVLRKGIHGISEIFTRPDSFNIESTSYPVMRDVFGKLPPKTIANAEKQIGTLGSGNHFIELQYVTISESNREVAEKWGLFDGQVIFMVHSGSRAWGGGIGTLYTKLIRQEMEKWGVVSPDRELVYAPIDSPVGREYYELMKSALNYALVNRHMMAFGVELAISEVFSDREVKFTTLYDLMHNYALVEPHRNALHLVHRKGATRALPAGHFLNIDKYKETGHPAIIPGSMGTSSYLMVGQDAGAKNFYSICHGAGRMRSRRATRELVTVEQFNQSLNVGTEDEILVNHRSLETILDECPQAYKDVDEIIDSIETAGLATSVARCTPLAVLKGV